jgi:hypothetical protein
MKDYASRKVYAVINAFQICLGILCDCINAEFRQWHDTVKGWRRIEVGSQAFLKIVTKGGLGWALFLPASKLLSWNYDRTLSATTYAKWIILVGLQGLFLPVHLDTLFPQLAKHNLVPVELLSFSQDYSEDSCLAESSVLWFSFGWSCTGEMVSTKSLIMQVDGSELQKKLMITEIPL